MPRTTGRSRTSDPNSNFARSHVSPGSLGQGPERGLGPGPQRRERDGSHAGDVERRSYLEPGPQHEQLGHEGTTEKIREKQKAGDIGGMAQVVSDDILSHFVVDSDWDGAAAAIAARYLHIAARVVLYFGAMDRDALDRWGAVAKTLSTR